MGVPTSEVGYTPAMPRREDHEVHRRTYGGIGRKKKNPEFTTHFTNAMLLFYTLQTRTVFIGDAYSLYIYCHESL